MYYMYYNGHIDNNALQCIYFTFYDHIKYQVSFKLVKESIYSSVQFYRVFYNIDKKRLVSRPDYGTQEWKLESKNY